MSPKNNRGNEIRAAWRLSVDGKTMMRAAKLTLVVGPVLVLINQGDSIVAGNQPNWLKMALTFAVPYCVSTWTSVTKDLEAIFRSINNQQRGN